MKDSEGNWMSPPPEYNAIVAEGNVKINLTICVIAELILYIQFVNIYILLQHNVKGCLHLKHTFGDFIQLFFT